MKTAFLYLGKELSYDFGQTVKCGTIKKGFHFRNEKKEKVEK